MLDDAVSVIVEDGIDRADDRPLLELRRTELNSAVKAGMPTPRGAPRTIVCSYGFRMIFSGIVRISVLAKTLGGFPRRGLSDENT